MIPNRASHVSKLDAPHTTVLGALTSTGQSVAAIAASAGITVGDAEKRLSLLVDEGLCTRTRGDRTTALYTVA